MTTRVWRECPVCGGDTADDKVIDLPVTERDDIIMVSARAYVCVRCGDWSMTPENYDKLVQAQKRLTEGNTEGLVPVGVVYRQP